MAQPFNSQLPTPNSQATANSQLPSNSQLPTPKPTPNSQPPKKHQYLGVGGWELLGSWELEVGSSRALALASAREMPPAVDGDRFAGNPAGLRRREKHDEVGNLIRLSRTTEGMRAPGVFEELRVLRLFHPAAAVQVRDDDAGIDGVDADALGRQFQRRAARELIERGLADAVRQHAAEGAQAGDARDVDDRAAGLGERGGGGAH